MEMDDLTKSAYRHLLYVAMVDFRNSSDHRNRFQISPLTWLEKYKTQRLIGGSADWLHNLAYFSSLDFKGFSEQQFWDEHKSMCTQYPKHRLTRYKEIFDNYLKGEIQLCL